MTRVVENTRITSADHFQDTRHIVLEFLPTSGVTYEPGDVIMVQPRNNPEVINELISRYSLNPDSFLKITLDQEQCSQVCKSSVIHFPYEGITVRELFEYWLNLMDPPSRYFVKTLSFFIEDSKRAEKLKEFASKTSEGKSEYFRYCVREKRTIFEVMHDFYGGGSEKFTLPLAYLIQLSRRQRPREFSISSCMKKHPGEVHLTMAVTDYLTPFKRAKKGVCSSWLASQIPKESEAIPVWFTKGTMKLPQADPSTGVPPPVIMVGPGTGIAAFRSFIESLSLQYPTMKLVLVFGCRSEGKDFYYQEEWKSIPNLNVLTAFSRDNEDGSKTYVQHVIRKEGAYFADLITKENAHIFVSGKAKNMPKSVEKAFFDVIKEHVFAGDEEKGKNYVLEMRKNHRYQQEVW